MMSSNEFKDSPICKKSIYDETAFATEYALYVVKQLLEKVIIGQEKDNINDIIKQLENESGN